ncbi:hypothetical protein B484DRAFT_403515 [Ochromonadaceae sp. CCMP2298]|nr:hypothetical protein B484DRAFT_403515 [Ochromonadaceae sp. CCMP2298]
MLSTFILICLCAGVAMALQPSLGLQTARSGSSLFSTLARPKLAAKVSAGGPSSIDVRAVPALARIQSSARASHHSHSTMAVRKNGGYPTQAVQDAVYLNLYVLLQAKNNDDQRKAVNYTFKEVAEFVSDICTQCKTLVDVPVQVAQLAGSFVENMVAPVLTQDQVLQAMEDVLPKPRTEHLLDISDLDILPTIMDKVAFELLHSFRQGRHFTIVEGYH